TLTLQKTNEEDGHLQVKTHARRAGYGAGGLYRTGWTLSRRRRVRRDSQKQSGYWPRVCSPAVGHGLGRQAGDGERSAVPGVVPRGVAGVVPHPAGRLAAGAPATTGGVAVLLPTRGVLSSADSRRGVGQAGGRGERRSGGRTGACAGCQGDRA